MSYHYYLTPKAQIITSSSIKAGTLEQGKTVVKQSECDDLSHNNKGNVNIKFTI